VPKVTERRVATCIEANQMDGPFAEIEFDFTLTRLVDGVDNQINERRVRAAA
jgi:catechol 1,2-dioxygenase